MCSIKNIDIYWNYWKFPRNTVAAEKFEIMISITIIFHYPYRVDLELDKVVCEILRITFTCLSCVDQIDKDWLLNCDASSQSRYARVEIFSYNTVLEYYNNWIIMELLDNRIPQV